MNTWQRKPNLLFLAALAVFFPLSIFTASQSAHADNGEVAWAWPIENINIDGDLSDWPDSMKRFKIGREYFGGNFPADSDFRPEFRVGYNVSDQSVYFAVEILDQSHQLLTEDEQHEDAWVNQDSVLLYLDPTHAAEGSGPLIYVASGPFRNLAGLSQAWDPEAATASWDNVELKTRRIESEHKTVYEWRVNLGDAVRSGRTLGLDFLVNDVDEGDTDNDSVLATWGPYGGKSRAASRVGDLVLMDPDVATGKLVGHIGWQDESEENAPRRVRITSQKDPQLKIHVQASEEGDYELQLPVGEYEITCPFKTWGEELSEFKHLDLSISVTAEISADAVTEADALKLDVVKSPNLLQEKGLLWDYDASREKEVDEFMQAYMAYFRVPGVSVAMVKDGKTVYYKTFGVRNFYTGEPVTGDTLFEACSITKIVFAFLANKMVEQGVLDLDKPLFEYLPFEDMEHDARYRKITARHCLAHRSGFPNWASNNSDGKLDIKAFPGTKFGYSGEGMEYLGRVVTHIYNQTATTTGPSDDSQPGELTLEEILRKEVLIPMGFNKNTEFSESDELQRVAAFGHYTNRTTANYIPSEIGVAHSMYTEAGTFANFVIALLNRENLSAEQYDEMLTPQTWVELHESYHGPRWERYFGLGFHLMDTPWGIAFGHGGSNGDFKCRVEAWPDENCGWVMFTNNDHGEMLYETFRLFMTTGKDFE